MRLEGQNRFTYHVSHVKLEIKFKIKRIITLHGIDLKSSGIIASILLELIAIESLIKIMRK